LAAGKWEGDFPHNKEGAMIDVVYLAHLIRTVLDGTPFPHLPRAIPLLLGTAAQESGLTFLSQIGGGPARGLFGMEGATEKDHWRYITRYRPALVACIRARTNISTASSHDLAWNFPYQILLARLHYFRRDPATLPQPTDIPEQARRWKRFYNTSAGAGTESQYLANYARLVAPYPAAVIEG
jgi:hypothetical protein